MRERLTYIRERRKGDGEILLIVRGGKAQKSRKKGDCSQESARYASCSFFDFFGIPVYIPL